MGMFSKIFRRNELKLHDEKIISMDERIEKNENIQKNITETKEQNAEPSPFLIDDNSTDEQNNS